MKLTHHEHQLIESARRLAFTRIKADRNLVGVLAEVDKCRCFKKLGYPSLFVFAVNDLKLSEEQAYPLITLARKGNIAPAFLKALVSGELSIGIANRVVSAITKENAEELIEYAKTHSAREVNKEVERRNGKPTKGELSADTKDLLKRAKSILASKHQRALDTDEAMNVILTEFLERHDPLKKAERALEKSRAQTPKPRNANGLKVSPLNLTPGVCTYRVPLTSREEHEVNVRDQCQCTYILPNGQRCPGDRWLHRHHIVPVSHGGSNEPENITTLCAQHHDLVHQMS
jgi:hypothetical protein